MSYAFAEDLRNFAKNAWSEKQSSDEFFKVGKERQVVRDKEREMVVADRKDCSQGGSAGCSLGPVAREEA